MWWLLQCFTWDNSVKAGIAGGGGSGGGTEAQSGQETRQPRVALQRRAECPAALGQCSPGVRWTMLTPILQ